MSEENFNPFTSEPEGGAGKTFFGLYRIVTKQVRLEAGASWSDPRYATKDGTWTFKGKKLDKTSKQIHVVQDLTCTAKDGHEYVAFADWMYWKNDAQCKAVLPSHKVAFGEHLEGIHGKAVYVQAEQIEVVDGNYTRKPFMIKKTFKNKAEMEAAREALFAKFGGEANGNGQTESASDIDVSEIKRMKAKGYSAEKIAGFMEKPLADVQEAYDA